jgi:hypothetical protein
MAMIEHQDATSIHAVPADRTAHGFRLLVLREFRTETAPPAFASIEQRLLRSPERLNRHGLSFAKAFLPEVVGWLSEHLGRPSVREGDGPPDRNPRWPTLSWHGKSRLWPDGTATIEWSVEVTFQDEISASAFQEHWSDRLNGRQR